jgi:uncharacterized membrane protein YphA (DoxX/SURF4 family)
VKLPLPATTSRLLEGLLRLNLAASFLYAGYLKARDPIQFLFDIRSFQLLPDPYAALVAVGLPWLEIFCGLGVLIKKFYAGSLTVLAVSLVVFMAAIAWSWQRGLDVSCGCFGKSAGELSYTWHLLRNGALLVVALGLLWWEWSRPTKGNMDRTGSPHPIPSVLEVP